MTDDNKIQKYWPLEVLGQDKGFLMELRTQLAWDLIHRFGSIAGEDGGEDAAGRSKLRLQTPQELVSRCFNIVDTFMAVAEGRDEIRSVEMSEEEAYERAGQLARIQSRAEYPIGDMPKGDSDVETTEVMALRSRHALERAELRRKHLKEVEEAKAPQKG